MTPEQRLDQLEPIIADIARKQDRMLGQIGMIVDQVSLHTVKLDDLSARVTSVERKVDTVASAVADLTLQSNRMEGKVDSLQDDLTNIRQTQEAILKLLQERLK